MDHFSGGGSYGCRANLCRGSDKSRPAPAGCCRPTAGRRRHSPTSALFWSGRGPGRAPARACRRRKCGSSPGHAGAAGAIAAPATSTPGLAVWLRNVVGIRRVGPLRHTPGASTGSSERPGREERPDALDPPQRPHHAGGPRRDRPLERALRASWPSATASPPRPSASGASAGRPSCRDRSSRPHKLPWKASEEERAVVCALRRATGFPLDDLTFVVRHFLPHLTATTSTASSRPRA